MDNVQLTIEQKRELAQWLLDNNYRCAITGSMLLDKLGIDIGREPKDIDIIIKTGDVDIREGITIPPFAKEIDVETKDGYIVLARYMFCDTKIEFLEVDEELEDLDDIESVLKELVSKKQSYISDGTHQACIDKHAKDIEAIEEWLGKNEEWPDKNKESLRQKYPWEL